MLTEYIVLEKIFFKGKNAKVAAGYIGMGEE
jgi:hypothetical protein